MIGDEELSNRFTHHPPFGNQPRRFQAIRSQAHDLGQYIDQNTPDSREKSLALTALEECVMWANAAIARNEKESTS
jgi:hypothetical protein